MTPVPAENRRNNFDFLRFLMATLVLAYHCFPLLYGAKSHSISVWERITTYGAGMGVDFFFVISGFLVSESWMRTPHAGRFLQKRVLRIYPAFLLASLFCALVIGPLGAADARAYWHALHPAGFVAYMLLLVGPYLPPVFLTLPFAGQVDGSFWTLRYEFECYLLVLFLGISGLLRTRVAVGWLFGMALGLTFLLALGLPVSIPNREFHLIGNPLSWSRLLLFFLSGMAFAQFRDCIRYSFARLLLAGAALVPGMLLANWQNFTLATAGVYLLFWFAFLPVPRLCRWAKHGDFSYGIYLFAYPVQQTLILFLRPHLTPLGLFCLALPLTLALAVISWHLVEQPALHWKRNAL